MYSYSIKSLSKLRDCDPRIQTIMFDVIKYYDNTIITGFRGKNEQQDKYRKGLSRVQFPNSKHNTFPSKAIDVAPWPIPNKWGADDWRDKVKFYELKAIVFFVAANHSINIRWGGDWDMDNDYKDQTFDDLLHFEVIDG